MLGGGGNLAYKPRKKKKDGPQKSFFSEKLTATMSKLFGGSKPTLTGPTSPTPKTRKEIEKEQMDAHYITFDFELPDQKVMILPEVEKRKKKPKDPNSQNTGESAASNISLMSK
jgi:hypothetical protein